MDGFFVEILRQDQLHADTRHDISALPNSSAQVFAKSYLYRRSICKHRVVKTVEVELDRFALDDMRRFSRYGDACESQLRFTARIEPTHLIRRPQICSEERQGCRKTNFVALGSARNRKQQRCVVLVNIGRRFTQLRLLRRIHALGASLRRNTFRSVSEAFASKA